MPLSDYQLHVFSQAESQILRSNILFLCVNLFSSESFCDCFVLLEWEQQSFYCLLIICGALFWLMVLSPWLCRPINSELVPIPHLKYIPKWERERSRATRDAQTQVLNKCWNHLAFVYNVGGFFGGKRREARKISSHRAIGRKELLCIWIKCVILPPPLSLSSLLVVVVSSQHGLISITSSHINHHAHVRCLIYMLCMNVNVLVITICCCCCCFCTHTHTHFHWMLRTFCAMCSIQWKYFAIFVDYQLSYQIYRKH